MAKQAKVKIKSGANIGEPAAEDDHRFLAECFISHPVIDALSDVGSHQSILLGRTGAGKSAMLWHLENMLRDATRIDPKEVAFQYIGTSPIIKQIAELGVDLHVLYEYLWMHIITLHITRKYLGANERSGLSRILASIRDIVRSDNKREIATNYLKKNVDSFWLTIEQVSSEFTSTVSERVAAEVGLSPAAFKAKVEGGGTWTDSERKAIKYRAQDVVSSLQMRELKETINALAECLDQKRNYYILIDDLDLEWAGDAGMQYALIRALIDSLKTFRRIPNLKIIIAMREDLFEAMLRNINDKHFQAEKYQGVVRRLHWDDELLSRVVDRRIQQLFKHAYTKNTVTVGDILPPQVNALPIRQYLLHHTLRRPRDIIAFVNKILIDNEGENLPLSAHAVNCAEPGYSRDRLHALEDEWRSCHPLVGSYVKSLDGLSGPHIVAEMNEDRLLPLAYEVSELDRKPVDDVELTAKTVYDRNKELRFRKLARSLVACLYKFGAIGVKLYTDESYTYCYQHRASIEDSEIGDQTKFIVHEMLASSLGCRQPKHRAA